MARDRTAPREVKEKLGNQSQRGESQPKQLNQNARGSRGWERWICEVGSETVFRARRLDDTAGRIEGRLYIHIGRVQQDGVVCLDHGG